MFVEPQTATINAVAKTMARMGNPFSSNIGVFKTTDGEVTLEIKQGKSKRRFNREAVLTQVKNFADPLTGLTTQISASAKIVVNEPLTGFTDTELAYLLTALTSWFSAGNRDKMLGGEI
jgi:hypothetical protein